MTIEEFELGATKDDIGRRFKIIDDGGDWDIKEGDIIEVTSFKNDGVAFCIYLNITTGRKDFGLGESVIVYNCHDTSVVDFCLWCDKPINKVEFNSKKYCSKFCRGQNRSCI